MKWFKDLCKEDEIEHDQDVVIIGAGMAGLYCAYMLNKQNPDLKIAIVERLNRTGGRIDSDLIKFDTGTIREEEGGMRFNYGMKQLMQLISEVDLCNSIVHFPMKSEDDTNRYFVRGRNFTKKEADDSNNMIWSELYKLKTQEKGLSPSQIVTLAFDAVLTENGMVQTGGEQPGWWTNVREQAKWKGRPLNQWQLWGLLRDMGYSDECVQMLTETIGFIGPFHSLANAGDAFQILADFPIVPKYFTLKKGFSMLPNKLAKLLEDDAPNVEFMLSTNVDVIAGDDKSGYSLTMTEAPDQRNAIPKMDGTTIKIQTKRLVIAIPTVAAKQLYVKSPALRGLADADKLWTNIDSALPMKLMKINLYFKSPWWMNKLSQRPPIQYGPSFTSMPINSIYPFYALDATDEKDQARETRNNPKRQKLDVTDGKDPKETKEAALTIYCDFTNTNFWHGLQNLEPMFKSDKQTEQNTKVPQILFPASQAVVDEARNQIGKLFGVTHVPTPILTSYRLWDDSKEFPHAYHQWKMSVKDSEVRDYLAAPRDNLHFCNEAISDVHGWVEGSLRSTNLVLKKMKVDLLTREPCVDESQTDDAVDPKHSGQCFWMA